VKAVLKQYSTKEAHQALGNALYEHDEKFRNLVDELAYGKPGVKPIYFAVPIGINGLIAGLGLLAACNIYYFTNKVSNKNSPEDNGYQPYEDEGQGNTGFQAHRDDNKRKEGYQAGETVEGSDGFEAEQKKWNDYLYQFKAMFGGMPIFMANLRHPEIKEKIQNDDFDKCKQHPKFGKFKRIQGSNLWISKDRAEHGQSKWKLYEKKSTNLKWKADLDENLDVMENKHKGNTGKEIPLKEFHNVNIKK